ncbi:Protein of unknown function [Anaerobranca californiensis DSM 14826]|jgi:uncharacterized membrane protein YheB (UPF0754 family)|uniref:DUF445 family protein n=1 Tax=Anaerobranca californiensis DSM 14826 TaxID=1120989 RepID=A0A1M6MIQ5_9FIRM|nr:DUF445 family protein [Anaerobranca californiensis]SHJ83369.1 Protein of unknown function [Anaerobranca californiensis DSM 14826]
MTIIKVLILAMIGGLIGWFTNYLAIKLMFKPYREITIPLLNLKFQGLIPKRRGEIANTVASTIEKELLSSQDIVGQLFSEENKGKILGILKEKINRSISDKLPLVLSMFSSSISGFVDSLIEKEGEKILDEVMGKGLKDLIKISSVIEEKINSFPLETLENIISQIAKKELKYIEILGGVLGFVIGLIQGVIVIILI